MGYDGKFLSDGDISLHPKEGTLLPQKTESAVNVIKMLGTEFWVGENVLNLNGSGFRTQEFVSCTNAAQMSSFVVQQVELLDESYLKNIVQIRVNRDRFGDTGHTKACCQ